MAQPIRDAPFAAGQTLRLGQVEITRAEAAAPQPAPTHSARLTLPAKARKPKNFYASIPAAFAFPFKGNAWGLLLGGTLAFGLMSLACSFRIGGVRMMGMPGWLGMPFAVLATGYLFLFMQSIITLTVSEEDAELSWPDFENVWDSAFRPLLQMLAILLVTLLPCLLYVGCVKHPEGWVSLALAGLGLLYLPMSLLALTIYDSVFALNPLLTFPAMAKAPEQYVVCVAILAALWIGTWALQSGVALLMPNEFVPAVITVFLALYTLCVEMRILGLLYCAKKKEFGWKLAD